MVDAVTEDAAAEREGVETEEAAERDMSKTGVASVEKTGRAGEKDGGKSEVKYAKMVVPMRFIMKGTLKYFPSGCTGAAEGGHLKTLPDRRLGVTENQSLGCHCT